MKIKFALSIILAVTSLGLLSGCGTTCGSCQSSEYSGCASYAQDNGVNGCNSGCCNNTCLSSG